MSTAERIEVHLTKDKAGRLGDAELKAEIERCQQGLKGAAGTTARRFRMRLSIMLEELHFRNAMKAGIV